MFTITIAVLIAVVVLLSFLLTKLLAILVGALLLYFCPILFLLFVAAGVVYFRWTPRGRARARRIAGTFSDRRPR